MNLSSRERQRGGYNDCVSMYVDDLFWGPNSWDSFVYKDILLSIGLDDKGWSWPLDSKREMGSVTCLALVLLLAL